MNYEFYFIKSEQTEHPEILRVIAPSFDSAASILAQQHGWHRAGNDDTKPVGEYIESLAIRPIEVQNIFESAHASGAR